MQENQAPVVIVAAVAAATPSTLNARGFSAEHRGIARSLRRAAHHKRPVGDCIYYLNARATNLAAGYIFGMAYEDLEGPESTGMKSHMDAHDARRPEHTAELAERVAYRVACQVLAIQKAPARLLTPWDRADATQYGRYDEAKLPGVLSHSPQLKVEDRPLHNAITAWLLAPRVRVAPPPRPRVPYTGSRDTQKTSQ